MKRLAKKNEGCLDSVYAYACYCENCECSNACDSCSSGCDLSEIYGIAAVYSGQVYTANASAYNHFGTEARLNLK